MEPYKTGAVAPDVAKRVVGKLPKERIPIVVKNEEARVRDDNLKGKKVKLAIPAARPIILSVLFEHFTLNKCGFKRILLRY